MSSARKTEIENTFATLTLDPKDKRKGWFTLTEKGRLVRDAYDDIVIASNAGSVATEPL